MNLNNFKMVESGVYTLNLNDAIGSFEIQGSVIANEIIHINKIGADRIDMELNSEGGSIIDGVRIASAMVESKVPIRTINKGYACSIAGVFYLLGSQRHMVNFGLLMLHNPQYGGRDMNDIEDPKKREVMGKMKKQLIQLIMAKNPDMEENMISRMMDQETWLNCDEAKGLGFVDNVISYANPPNITRGEGELATEYVNKIKNFHCSLEQNNSNNLKKMQMDDLKKQYEARLTEKDSNIKELTNNVAKYKEEIAALNNNFTNLTKKHEAENEQLNEKLTAQNGKIKKFEDAVAADIVNNAIEAGKFIPENRDALIEKAKLDIDGFKAMIEMIPESQSKLDGKPTPKISDILDQAESLEEINKDDLNGKTQFEYLQKNDSVKLKSIKNNQPAVYAAMRDEFINKTKNLQE